MGDILIEWVSEGVTFGEMTESEWVRYELDMSGWMTVIMCVIR